MLGRLDPADLSFPLSGFLMAHEPAWRNPGALLGSHRDAATAGTAVEATTIGVAHATPLATARRLIDIDLFLGKSFSLNAYAYLVSECNCFSADK